MRFQSFNTVSSVLGLAALAASIPSALSIGPADVCFASPTSTVFVTVSSVDTVTVHHAASTVFITVAGSHSVHEVSLLPTTVTSTRTSRSTLTIHQSNTIYATSLESSQTGSGDITKAPASFETTVTEYAYTTITVLSTTSPASPPLSFIVKSGTTSWLNGVAPDSTVSLDVVTSAVTVIPTPQASSAATTILKQTTVITKLSTFTATLSAETFTSQISSGSTFTGIASGGWNKTKAVVNPYGSGTTALKSAGTKPISPNSTLSLSVYIPVSTLDIYHPQTISSLSTMAAKSGFDVFTSSDPTLTVVISTSLESHGASTSSALGLFTLTSSSKSTFQYALPSSSSNFFGYVNNTITPSSSSLALGAAASSTSTVRSSEYSLSASSVIPILPEYSNFTSTLSTRSSFVSPDTSFSSTLSRDPDATSITVTSSASDIKTSPSSGVQSPPVQYSVPPPSGTVSATSRNLNNSSGFSSSSLVLVSVSSSSIAALPPFQYSVPALSSPFTTLSTIYSADSSISTEVSSISLSQIPTSTSLSSASATACGEHGDFTLNFDDIPPLSIGNQSVNDVQPEPVFNPYHQFDFSDGFTVVPPPTDPYLPSSAPLLLEFIPNFNVNGSNPSSGPNTAEDGYSGDIGNGDHGLTGCFSFNLYGASFGCDSKGPSCDFAFTGYQYDRTSGSTDEVVFREVSIPSCTALADCSLAPITLDNTFMNLDKVRINVTVAGTPKIWWMDDLKLGWSNNTCAAGLGRISTHLH